jgi:hypothetical protein
MIVIDTKQHRGTEMITRVDNMIQTQVIMRIQFFVTIVKEMVIRRQTAQNPV